MSEDKPTLEQMVQQYIQLRDEKTRINREAKDKVGVIDETMQKIEAAIHHVLTETGQESAKTKAGTAFKSTKDYVGVTEIEDFREFLSEESSEDPKIQQLILNNFPWHFFTKAISKDAVKTYMKESGGEVPAGVNYDKEIVVSIRK